MEKLDAALMEHIAKFGTSPQVSRVLGHTSTFKQEVEQFYGLSTWYDLGGLGDPFNGRRYKLIAAQEPSKQGAAPQALIDALAPVHERAAEKTTNWESLDAAILHYDAVRENYSRYQKWRPYHIVAGLACLAAPLVVGQVTHDFPVFSMMGGIPSGLYFIRVKRDAPGWSYPSLTQYIYLHEAAVVADGLLARKQHGTAEIPT